MGNYYVREREREIADYCYSFITLVEASSFFFFYSACIVYVCV